MSYSLSTIATVIDAVNLQEGAPTVIENLLTDSRKLLFPESTLFFALPGAGRSGKSFISSLYEKGVRSFVTDRSVSSAEVLQYPDASFLSVENVLHALQELTAFHRHQMTYPVIGITGSNGKTIVKDWLSQLLGDDYRVIRSPKSYNSQVGVPLSVWRMNEGNDLAIFESGISQPGEMARLQRIIDPEIGIVTFIGSAHAEGFASVEEKISEKLLLFTDSKLLIYDADNDTLAAGVSELKQHKNTALKTFTYSRKAGADLQVTATAQRGDTTQVACVYLQQAFSFSIPFTDAASINNAITCCAALLVLRIPTEAISEKMPHLRPVEMRLEMRQGRNNCTIINDGYSADMQSLSIALDFLQQQQQHEKRTVILSDLLQSGRDLNKLYTRIADMLAQKNVGRLIGIGPQLGAYAGLFSGLPDTSFFESTADFIRHLPDFNFRDETVLLKGARVFRFEKISSILEHRIHETVLEVNLNAVRHNLRLYRSQLGSGVKVMVMVKAFSYGSGSFEIASLLQHEGVDYLGVAYADEGAELRRNGISLPIMVLNTEVPGFDSIVTHRLEPELYSFHILQEFSDYLRDHQIIGYPVHIKIDTGMHRLGFEESDIPKLCAALKAEPSLKVLSVFSHLAGSDDTGHDEFSLQQAMVLKRVADDIEQALGYGFMRHLGNSAAIVRLPDLQLDMVRLGIGLYGVAHSAEMQQQLQPVTTLKTTISQVRQIKAGDSVGYGRKGMVLQDSRIATVQIGYADGYPRILGNGRGKMLVNGSPAPVIGNVCMDMTMLDISGLEAEEGDEVIVFGEVPAVSDVATWADTIPYEILTNISQRVKRVYFEE